MKVFKRILIVVAVILIVIVAVSQLMPAKYHVERSVVIAAKPEIIFPWINNLKKWPEWTPWNLEKDPTIAYAYDGPDEGVGAITSWDSKKWGDGKMKIAEADPAKGVKLDLSFAKGKYSCLATFTFEPSGNDTKVTWAMDGLVSRNPLDRYLSVFMDSMAGKDFSEGLTNLKKKVENK